MAPGLVMRFLLAALVWALAMPQVAIAQDIDRGPTHSPGSPPVLVSAHAQRAGLLDRAATQGTIPIIVRLNTELVPDPALPGLAARIAQRENLMEIQEKVLQRLSITPGLENAAGIKRFRLYPGLAMQASASDIDRLLDDPEVAAIVEDVPIPTLLSESATLLGADGTGMFSGFSGQGQVIAVLDTGVDKYHPFLVGKVVSEACFSSNVPSQGAASLCPAGVTESTAPESGLNCHGSVAGCSHGTHVAGIAAGSGDSYFGVARDAGVIAIQVFSEFSGNACTDYGMSSPCILSYTSDQLKALERVFDLRLSFNIAAVNMSLGGGQYTNACDSHSLKPSIDNLRAVGIATVIASGNAGSTNAISSPACISSAVSVGSTTKSDAISSFSNSSDLLDLLAPGSSIRSSVLNNKFGRMSGTSMAAPHVAGAWAVLREGRGDASVEDILAALADTGILITDTRSGAANRLTPRIRVAHALDVLVEGNLPPPEDPPEEDTIGEEPAAPVQLTNTDPVTNLSDSEGNELYFYIDVPPGATNLIIGTSGGSGDVDLHVRFGNAPSLTQYDCRPYLLGNDESCTFETAAEGTYHVMLHAWEAYSGVTLTASFDQPSETACAFEENIEVSGTVTAAEEITACRNISTGAEGYSLESTASAIFTAGQRITFSPGFRVKAGGRLSARIDSTLSP